MGTYWFELPFLALSSIDFIIYQEPGRHTIALSRLRLLDVLSRVEDDVHQIILLTAMTHAAIDACLAKLSHLVEKYHEIPDLPTAWLDNVKIEHVLKGNDHAPPKPESHYIYTAGTVYRVSPRLTFEFHFVLMRNNFTISVNGARSRLIAYSLTKRAKCLWEQPHWLCAVCLSVVVLSLLATLSSLHRS